MTQYRIEWRYIDPSIIYNGDWSDSKNILESSIEYLNKQHAGVIIHWLATKWFKGLLDPIPQLLMDLVLRYEPKIHSNMHFFFVHWYFLWYSAQQWNSLKHIQMIFNIGYYNYEANSPIIAFRDTFINLLM